MKEMRFVYDVSVSGCGEYNSTAVPMTSNTDQTLNNSIMSLLSTEFDTTDVDKPHAYLVWMFYDQNMNLDVANSGAAKVQNPNSLETLLRNDLDVSKDGYLHAYVSNGSAAAVNFDNFLVQYQRGKLRQINDYYPYGLTIAGINSNSDEYLNKYTSKELQTGEFDTNLSTGLEMFDFGSRFGACPEQMVWRISACRRDPQLGVWFTPDPAEQFHNPYLGIGNNPVMYVDPDGEWALIDDAIAFAIGGTINLTVNAFQGNLSGDGFWKGVGKGFAAFGAGGASGTLSLYGPAGWIAGGAIVGSTNAWLSGAQGMDIVKSGGLGAVTGFAGGAIGQGLAPAISSLTNNISSPVLQGAVGGSLGGAASGAVIGGTVESFNNGSFWQGAWNGTWTGALTGGIAGGASAGAQARSLGLNPFTGDVIPPKVMNAMEPRSFNSTYSKEMALPSKLSHYSPSDPRSWTSLGFANEPNKINYLSTNPELTRASARSDLSLNKTPNYRIDINTDAPGFDPSKITLIRRVNGNVYNQGGGGWEVLYKGPINFDPNYFSVTILDN